MTAVTGFQRGFDLLTNMYMLVLLVYSEIQDRNLDLLIGKCRIRIALDIRLPHDVIRFIQPKNDLRFVLRRELLRTVCKLRLVRFDLSDRKAKLISRCQFPDRSEQNKHRDPPRHPL